MASRLSDSWFDQYVEDARYGLHDCGPAEQDYLEENRGWLIGWTPSPEVDDEEELEAA